MGTKITARQRALRGTGRDRAKKLAVDARWRERNREYLRALDKVVKARNPELYLRHAKQSQLRRRARKAGAQVEPVFPTQISRRDSGICHLCLKPVKKLGLDHLIPICRGGAHAMWNLMLAHELCNKRRGTKQILPEETKEAAEAYIVERTKRYAELAA